MAETVDARSYGIRPPGHRLPDTIRLGPVLLQVADLERSLAFYRRVLGLRPLERPARPGPAPGAALAAPGADEPLVELVERPDAAPVPRRGRLGLYHFAIKVPDRAALGRLLAHLAANGVPVGMADHLVSEAVYLADPDGLGIEVYADRPRGEWRRDGRELVMTTEPLDAEAVLRAGRGEPWTAMPPGTVIGHVHFSVGSLETAADFYHRGLGFDKVVWSYPGALFLSVDGYHHHVGLNTWAAGAPPAGEGDARLLEWTLILPGAEDLGAVARSLGEAGHAVSRPGRDVVADDPWGTRVRLTTD
ncbi:MAG TPA: VOC family protein [Gemmatimonadales bacterium]|nr:VOC family protein [Gemmatimonadales bacterium]